MSMQKAEMPLGKSTLSIETGRMAKQADGAVLVRLGDTVVLATACAQREPRAGIDFLPLTVDYRENTYAAGKIPGGFFKREGRPNEKEVLTSRMIDRPLRPLFPEGYGCETQVVGAAAVGRPGERPRRAGDHRAPRPPCASPTSRSRRPIGGGARRLLGRPVRDQPDHAGAEGEEPAQPAGRRHRGRDRDGRVRRAGADRGRDGARARRRATRRSSRSSQLQKELRSRVGKPKRDGRAQGAATRAASSWAGVDAAGAAARGHEARRASSSRYAKMKQVKDELLASLAGDGDREARGGARIYDGLREKIMREEILVEQRRPRRPEASTRSARSPARWACCRARTAPRCSRAARRRRSSRSRSAPARTRRASTPCRRRDYEKRFMLHYNFPPFSVGEVKFLRGPGRREIGHGALAERALARHAAARGGLPLHGPHRVGHPRVERLVVDGVDLRRHAGADGRGRAAARARWPAWPWASSRRATSYAILSDIVGDEDHYGDMDFKVAGTRDGHHGAADGHQDRRHHARRSWPRRWSRPASAGCTSWTGWPRRWRSRAPNISPYAPRIITIKIPVDKIRDIIGPGGKMIRSIVERTGCKIDVEDDGRVSIASTDEAAARKAVAIIEELTATAELNKTYLGKVVRVVDFGAFVEILPGHRRPAARLGDVAPARATTSAARSRKATRSS